MVQTKVTFSKAAKLNGFHTEKGFTQAGFIFKDLSASQTAYTFINNANNWLRDNFGTNISAFYEENALPCMKPDFARYTISELCMFTGHLVATSFNTARSMIAAKRAKKYFYIQDVEYIRNDFNDKPLFDKILHDDSIIKIFRSEDHYNKFLLDGYKINKVIVPDFDISMLLEVIKNENK